MEVQVEVEIDACGFSEICFEYYVVYIIFWNCRIFLSKQFNPLGMYRHVTKSLKGIIIFATFLYLLTAFFYDYVVRNLCILQKNKNWCEIKNQQFTYCNKGRIRKDAFAS